LRDKPIGLIKWRKAGLGNLFVSPCLSRRIRKKGRQGLSGRPTTKLTLSMKIAPTNLQISSLRQSEGYYLKSSSLGHGDQLLPCSLFSLVRQMGTHGGQPPQVLKVYSLNMDRWRLQFCRPRKVLSKGFECLILK
jgi:hypothetical protein